MRAEMLPKSQQNLSACTSRHSPCCKSACAPRVFCSWIKQSRLPRTPATRVPQRSRLRHHLLATRTAVGVSERPEPDDFPPEALTNLNSGKARRTSSAAKKPTKLQQLADWFKQALSRDLTSLKDGLQLLQLCVLVSLLFVTPAYLFCGKIPQQADHLGLVYLAFFGFGSVRRIWIHGKLTSRRQDAQVQTPSGKLSLVVFVLMIVAGQLLS